MRRLASFLVLCTAICAGAADPPKLPPELALIPTDAMSVSSVKLSKIWNSPVATVLRNATKGKDDALQLNRLLGDSPENVERVTMMSQSTQLIGSGAPVFVITYAKPYDLASVIKNYGAVSPNQFEPRPIGPDVPFGPPVPMKVPFEPPFPGKGEQKLPPGVFPGKEAAIPAPKAVGPDTPVENPKGGEPIAKKPEPKLQLNARYFIIPGDFGGSGDQVLLPIDARTIVLFPYAGGDRGPDRDPLLAWTAGLLRRRANGPLADALALAVEHDIVNGFNPKAFESLLDPDGGRGFGVGALLPIRSLIKSESITSYMDVGLNPNMITKIRCPDAATARRAGDLYFSLIVLVREIIPGLAEVAAREGRGFGGDGDLKPLVDVLENLIGDIETKLDGNTAVVSAKLNLSQKVFDTMLSSVARIRARADEMKSQNNLKQMGIAIHSYHDAYNRLPFPGLGAPKGQQFGTVVDNPGLSWRVAILPFIEQENLYRQFRFDEPWDSEHNKKLIPLMPKVYAVPGRDAPAGQTYYRAFDPCKKIARITDILDGTSNTIAAIEADESVPWTKPEFLPVPNEQGPKFGDAKKGTAQVLMFDASVRTIPVKFDWKILRLLVLPNDGMPIPDFDNPRRSIDSKSSDFAPAPPSAIKSPK